MHTKFYSLFCRQNARMLALGTATIAMCFAIGIETAGDVEPIALIQAGSPQLSGDIDGNGRIDQQDVRIILEVAQGYSVPTPEQLLADPNRDGQLTVSDALQLLATLSTL